MMQLDVLDKNLIVKIKCDIDHHVTDKIKEKIERELEVLNLKNIIFDFERVDFMDSSGIGMLIGRYKFVDKIGGKIYVINLNPNLKPIIEMSGLKKIINFDCDLESVLKSQRKSKAE